MSSGSETASDMSGLTDQDQENIHPNPQVPPMPPADSAGSVSSESC